MTTRMARAASRLATVRWPGAQLLPNFIRFGRRKPLGAISAVILVGWAVVGLFANFLPLDDPLKTNVVGGTLLNPGWSHWAGTDEIGRDVLSRIIYSVRVEYKLAFSSVALGTMAGALLGLVSGYVGGLLDLLVQRVVDAIMALPPLVLILALASLKGAVPIPDDLLIIVALSFVILPGATRVVRGTVLSTRENVYVEASRAMGASTTRILFRHILPNVTAPIIVISSVALGGIIIASASLSFLGFGVQPPTPSWGAMLSVSSRYYMEEAPWLAIAPGVAISTVVFAFNLLGDALRDTLDPRLRGR